VITCKVFIEYTIIIGLVKFMNLHRISIEYALVFLILLTAFIIRILSIGISPLSDVEAGWAMQAFQVSIGENVILSPGPIYSLLTGATFFLFADTNFFARLWPVLAGCCLVIFPILIRSAIGRKAALVMSLGLALDAGLVAMSRQTGTAMLAVGFGAMTLGLVYNRKPILAGIFGGLTLLSGPTAIQGLLGLGLAWSIGVLLLNRGVISSFIEKETATKLMGMRSAFFAALVVVIVIGTLFFTIPEGLSAVTGILPKFIQGWLVPSEVPFTRILAILVFYHPLALIFAIVAIVQGWRRKDAISQWLSLWAGSSMLLVLFYPGRQVSDLGWVLIPMWGLAAIEIAKLIRIKDADPYPALGQALLIFILMALGWLNLAGLSLSGGDSQTIQLRWVVILGTFALGAVTTVLIGLGWSVKTAQQGLVWGLLLGIGFYGIATMWGLSQLKPNGEQELLTPNPVTRQVEDLLVTLGDLSEWRTGIRDSLDVVVTSPAPSLRWALRNWPQVRFLASIPAGELPSMIINSENQPSPSLSVGYRGQDFAWWITPAWDGPLPRNWPEWLVFRRAPQEISHLVLWARGDIFPGGELTPVEDPEIIEDEEIPIEESPFG
jgi:hypothetical protein